MTSASIKTDKCVEVMDEHTHTHTHEHSVAYHLLMRCPDNTHGLSAGFGERSFLPKVFRSVMFSSVRACGCLCGAFVVVLFQAHDAELKGEDERQRL